MRINPILFGFGILAIFLGTILGFQAAGIWSVSGKTTGSGESVQPVAGDVNTIKGWMTLEQISTVYDVPLAELLAQFNLPAGTPGATAIKDLESETFSVTNLRAWLLSRTQTARPNPAVTPTPPATLTPSSVLAEPAATALPTEHVAADRTVTGKTSFQDLLDWGVKEDAIRQVIGDELPAFSIVIKDYVTQKGLEFTPVRTSLQTEVDQTK